MQGKQILAAAMCWLAAAFAAACNTAANDESAAAAAEKPAPVFADAQGRAIGGADAVAYHLEGRAVQGAAQHAYQWRGAAWHFASAEHRALFAAAPQKYAPQYGGYCAWAVAHGYTAEIDPRAWRIVEGRLFLNYNLDIREQWDEAPAEYIRRADANWPGLAGAAAR